VTESVGLLMDANAHPHFDPPVNALRADDKLRRMRQTRAADAELRGLVLVVRPAVGAQPRRCFHGNSVAQEGRAA